MSNSETSLVFVYNADSGTFNSLKDILTRIVTPSRYSCRLCGLTYGALGMKANWRKFLDSLGFSVKFYHRDEFVNIYKLENFEFPAVYMSKNNQVTLLISQMEINNTKSLDDLMNLISTKVNEIKI